MKKATARFLVIGAWTAALVLTGAAPAVACPYKGGCAAVNLSDAAANLNLFGPGVAGIVAGNPAEVVDYVWRLRDPCLLAAEADGYCSPVDVRVCPQEPGRVIGFFVVQRRAVVRPDGTAVTGPVPAGLQPGDLLGSWTFVREGCIDITDLNPPPLPGEVYSYFQRLPLPQLATQHQPPFDGLSQLPVIFYTDSPTTQTFTVDIRGFTVVIDATAELYTWHTGEPFTITNSTTITSADPGRPYPNQTVTHTYNSGTYTAWLTVTWGATFTVNGGAAADVPGTTTTDGPPVTFDVLQARPVLVDPFN